MSRLRRAGPGTLTASLASSKLGTTRVTGFALSAVAPLTVSAGVVPVAFATTGLTGLPVIFPAVALVLGVFAVGYVAMARRVRNAGAFYALVTHGLGRRVGVAAAFVSWAAYSCFVAALYGSIGPGVDALAQAWGGFSWPWWIWALAAWALVSALGLLRISIAGRVLAVLLGCELVITGVFIVVYLLHPAGGTVSVSSLSPGNLVGPGIGALVALAMTSFTGFEGAATFTEESRSERTVGRAIYLSLAVAAGGYMLFAWALTVTVGPDKLVAVSAAGGADTAFILAGAHLPAFVVDMGRLFFTTSMLAALISFRSMADRYLYSLGREGVIWRRFGAVSTRTGAPVTASLFMTALSVLVIAVYAVSGADPLLKLFYFAAGLGGFGILALVAVTSVAVVRYFARHPREAAHVTHWQGFIAPTLAAITLTGLLVLVLLNFDVLLGVTPHSPLRWLLPASYLAPIAGGLVWASILARRRPAVYDAIGLGPEAASSTRTTPNTPSMTRETV